MRCLARRTSSLGYLPQEVELAYGDLVSGAGLPEAARGVSAVIHVAGTTKAFRQRDYIAGNVTATRNLLDACLPEPRFVYVSSLAAAGPQGLGHPVSWYGESKRAAEDLVRLRRGAVIVRPPVVYGPRDTDVFQVFRWIGRGVMPAIGGAGARFSHIHVADLAEALAVAASLPAAADRTFFVSGGDVTWEEFARAAAGLLGRRVKVVAVPKSLAYAVAWFAEIADRLKGRPGILSRQKVAEAAFRDWTCPFDPAMTELGFRPRPLVGGLKQTLAWYKDAGWL